MGEPAAATGDCGDVSEGSGPVAADAASNRWPDRRVESAAANSPATIRSSPRPSFLGVENINPRMSRAPNNPRDPRNLRIKKGDPTAPFHKSGADPPSCTGQEPWPSQ